MFGDDGEYVSCIREIKDTKESDHNIRQSHCIQRIDDADVGVLWHVNGLPFEEKHGDGDEFGFRETFGDCPGYGEAVACSGKVVEYCFHGGDRPDFLVLV